MVCVSFAKVVTVNLDSFILRDLLSGTEIKGRSRGNAAFEIAEGQEGLFRGWLQPDHVFEVHAFDKRELLNPLHEKDLFGASGRFTLTELVDDPFTEYFRRFQDQVYEDPEAIELINNKARASEAGPSSPAPQGGGEVGS